MTDRPEPEPTDSTSRTPGVPAAAGYAAPAGVSLWKYLGIFAATMVGLSLILAIIEEVLDTSVTGVSMIVTIVAAMTAVDSFVKANLRVLEPSEKWWLIGWSFAVALLWSLLVGLVVLVVVVASGDGAGLWDELGVWLAVAVVIGVVVSFLLIWFGYAVWPKRSLRNRLKYLERQAAKRR